MELTEQLKSVAPNVAFSVSKEVDPHFQWDGDGPDPAEDGYEAFDVTVTASAIVNGELLEGHSYLGGSYFLPEEPPGDVHGYFPQMAQEAATDLREMVLARLEPTDDVQLRNQLHLAIAVIETEMKRRYAEQQSQ